MTVVSSAFRRWLAAQEDVRDANALLMFYIRTADVASQPGQARVTRILQDDVDNALTIYLKANETVAQGEVRLCTAALTASA